MAKFLGLDLGTNSIGWAIRDSNEMENQIVDYGVVIFKKGVGDGKSGEFSLAAERRKNRGKRRLYNAKRYRKWATLKVLSKNVMCPLNEEELRLWSIGNWREIDGKKKNSGRVYPTSPDFIAWLAMDFSKIGKEWKGEKLKPEFTNTYELRINLLENYDENDPNRLLKIGRAFYHLVQRRGFKTSRKSGKSAYGENEYLENKLKENPEWKASQILQEGLIKDNRRIRNSGVIQRRYFEEEFAAICKRQNINNELQQEIHKAIYFVRPLRTQKGLVGKCTLEKGKTRIPISHPAYEEFRALQYINNIQWRETGSKKKFENIPVKIKKNIFQEIFFKKLERGDRKGMTNDRGYFEFKEIVDRFSENHKYEFNYAKYKNENFELWANPNVSTCPVIAGLMNVFEDDWLNKFIQDENKFGIDWHDLKLNYEVKYQEHAYPKSLNYIDIWHLLFDYIQTRDKEEELQSFCQNVLCWGKGKTDEFKEIGISLGYGSLSFSAIHKIVPYLQEGFIYSEAVSFANLNSVLGKEIFEKNKKEIERAITETINEIDKQKELLNITNGLIQQFFGENNTHRAKGVNGTEEEINAYKNDVASKLENYFGVENWKNKPNEEKLIYESFILNKYLLFLDGKQEKEEKASSRQNKNPEIDYYKLPRLDDAIKKVLKEKFGATDSGLKKLYHPSDIDIYPKSKTGRLEDPNPPSKGWKNPMAMRTMYELRKLVNYLLDIDKVDENTKLVVELARELNDANKRWAIQTYQKSREDENKEFAKAIIGLAKEKYPNLNENDGDNIDKIRLWWEQLENGEEVYKEIKTLKEDVQKYRFWKEQEGECLYTGKMIGIVDLFDGTKTQFEHTLFLSQSFDNSLANLTVCDAEYNMQIKRNQIPTQLKNYKEEWNGYPAIEPKLQKWKDKVQSLKDRIEKNKIETKKAIRSADIERKNYLIRLRHLLQFDLEYWDKKLKTFTVSEIPNWWKNSQLIDTQIISKYARAYLKTVFNKVDVQKGSITAEFRKIYEIMGDEKKDRSKHSHHAIDAAVLTLIPGSARREAILEEAYKYNEKTFKQYHEKPYSDYSSSHILDIENNILINHVIKDQTLTKTKKNVRKRGEIEFLKNKKTKQFILDGAGKKIPMKMQGDSIRGPLHKESFFGAIKVNERNKEGFVKKENGEYILKKINGQDEIWVVSRKEIEKIDFDKDVIVDEILKKHLKTQLENGIKQNELVDFNNHKIRHLRCRVKAGRGFLKIDTAIPIKEHVFKSNYKHKQEYYVQNDENYLYLLYEGKGKNDKIVRGYQILNLFKIAQLKIENLNELWSEPEYQILRKSIGKNELILTLKAILRVGDKVLFFKEHKEEITKENLNDRLH